MCSSSHSLGTNGLKELHWDHQSAREIKDWILVVLLGGEERTKLVADSVVDCGFCSGDLPCLIIYVGSSIEP